MRIGVVRSFFFQGSLSRQRTNGKGCYKTEVFFVFFGRLYLSRSTTWTFSERLRVSVFWQPFPFRRNSERCKNDRTTSVRTQRSLRVYRYIVPGTFVARVSCTTYRLLCWMRKRAADGRGCLGPDSLRHSFVSSALGRWGWKWSGLAWNVKHGLV